MMKQPVTGLPTVVKLVDKETLLKEREEKKKVREERECVMIKVTETGNQRLPVSHFICI